MFTTLHRRRWIGNKKRNIWGHMKGCIEAQVKWDIPREPGIESRLIYQTGRARLNLGDNNTMPSSSSTLPLGLIPRSELAPYWILGLQVEPRAFLEEEKAVRWQGDNQSSRVGRWGWCEEEKMKSPRWHEVMVGRTWWFEDMTMWGGGGEVRKEMSNRGGGDKDDARWR